MPDPRDFRLRSVLWIVLAAISVAAVLRYVLHAYGGISGEDIRLNALLGAAVLGAAVDGYFFLSPPPALKSNPLNIGKIPSRAIGIFELNRDLRNISRQFGQAGFVRFSEDTLEVAQNRGARRATCPVLLQDVPYLDLK